MTNPGAAASQSLTAWLVGQAKNRAIPENGVPFNNSVSKALSGGKT